MPAATPAPTDYFGTELPKRCRDAFCDKWLADTFDFLCAMSEKFRAQRFADGIKKRAKYYPFINSKDFASGCGFIIQYLDDLIGHIKAHRPAGVCPACAGSGCGACRMSGLVSRSLYDELKGKT